MRLELDQGEAHSLTLDHWNLETVSWSYCATH